MDIISKGASRKVITQSFITYRVGEMIKHHFPAQEVSPYGGPHLIISISLVDHLHCRCLQQQGYKLIREADGCFRQRYIK